MDYNIWDVIYRYRQEGRYFSLGKDGLGQQNRFSFIATDRNASGMNNANSTHYQMWNELIALANPDVLSAIADEDGHIEIEDIPTDALWNGLTRKAANLAREGDAYWYPKANSPYHDSYYSDFHFDYVYSETFATIGIPVVGITLEDTVSDSFDVAVNGSGYYVECFAEPEDGATLSYTVNDGKVSFSIKDYAVGTELTFKIHVDVNDEKATTIGEWIDSNKGDAKLTINLDEDNDEEYDITSPRAHLEGYTITTAAVGPGTIDPSRDVREGVSATIHYQAESNGRLEKVVVEKLNPDGTVAETTTYAGSTLTGDVLTHYDFTNVQTDWKITAYFIELRNVTVTKTWDDQGNQYNTRPGSMTFTLTADGTAVSNPAPTVTKNETSNAWVYTWKDLPKYHYNDDNQRVDVVYNATEGTDAPKNYTAGQLALGADGNFTITNKLETTTLNGAKTWDDGDDKDGIRPASITMHIVDGSGKTVGDPITVTPDADGHWTWSVSGLPKLDENGQEIQYSFTEDEITYTNDNIKNGYTSTIEGNTITYTVQEPTIADYVSEVSAGTQVSTYEYPTNISDASPDQDETTSNLVNVPGGSNWHIQPGLTTDHIEATEVVFGTLSVANATIKEYYANGAPVPNSERVFWKNSGNNNSKVDTGNCITFIPKDFSSYALGSVISTDHYITLTFPNAVTILDGTSSGTTRDVVLTISNFDVIRKKERNWQRILYSAMWAGPGDGRHNIGGMTMDINFSVPGVNAVDVLISFVDIDVTENDSITGYVRNESVSFVKGFSDTFYTINDLTPRAAYIDLPNSHFAESTDGSMRGWARAIDNSSFKSGMVGRANLADGGFTIRWTGSGCATGIFDQVKPFELKVTIDELTAGGVGGTISEQGDWRFRDYGEDKIITIKPEDGYHIEKITIDGNDIALDGFDENGVMTVADTGWTGGINKGKENITLYQRADGVVDVYLPKQFYALASIDYKSPARVDHWIDASFTPNGSSTLYTVTNTMVTSLEGTKTWVHGSVTSPTNEALSLVLMQNGEDYAYDKATQLSWNGNTFTIINLPAFDEDGDEYTYTVREDPVPAGYTMTQTGNDITNTLNQVEVDVIGRKTWKDGGRTHNNSEDLTITLRRASTTDGTTYGTPVALDLTPEWDGDTYKFEHLPKYDDARYEYKYSVTETLSEALINSVLPDVYVETVDNTGFNFINSLTGKTSFSDAKTWIDDEETHDNSSQITLVLMRESEKVTKRNVNNATQVWDGDAFTYSELDKYDDDGYPYTYSVRESKLNGTAVASVTVYDIYYDGNLWVFSSYEPQAAAYSVSGTNITNVKHIDIPVKKVWQDANDQDGKRPASITVVLLANDEETDKTLTLNESNQWKDSFTNLSPKDATLNDITYTLKEISVEEYTTLVTGSAKDGFTVTNTHEPETTKVTATKSWDDAENQDGKRPSDATVQLYKTVGGTKTAVGVR